MLSIPTGLLTLLLTLTVIAASQGSSDGASPRLPPQGSAEQIERGAELYTHNCAVCHGKTGLGFTEARAAFPEDHQRCERCHRRTNPPQMTMHQMAPNNAFSVGEPPALQGAGALSAYSNALALHHYIRATMPRYEPGRLSDSEYLDITAFLLELNGYSAGRDALDEARAAALALDNN